MKLEFFYLLNLPRTVIGLLIVVVLVAFDSAVEISIEWGDSTSLLFVGSYECFVVAVLGVES